MLVIVGPARLCRRRWRVAGTGADAGTGAMLDVVEDAGRCGGRWTLWRWRVCVDDDGARRWRWL